MIATLAVIRGGSPSECQLSLPFTIGRSRSCALQLDHPQVSRRHCELFAQGNRLFIRDLGSMNGTQIGTVAVQTDTPLAQGEQFTVGPFTLEVRSVQASVSGGEANHDDAVRWLTEHPSQAGLSETLPVDALQHPPTPPSAAVQIPLPQPGASGPHLSLSGSFPRLS